MHPFITYGVSFTNEEKKQYRTFPGPPACFHEDFFDGVTILLPTEHSHYYRNRGLFEEKLIMQCIPLVREKVFIDIGAHSGSYAVLLAPFASKVYAFEPQKRTFYALCGSVALSGLDKKINCFEIALGSGAQAEKKVGKLHIVSPDGGGSTVHEPKHASSILSTETIVFETLDNFHIKDVGLIKIDVEGNEFQVLSGARATIVSSRPVILFESNSLCVDSEIEDFFREINYTCQRSSEQNNMFFAFPR